MVAALQPRAEPVVVEAIGTVEVFADGVVIRAHGALTEMVFWRAYDRECREVCRVFLAREDRGH